MFPFGRDSNGAKSIIEYLSSNHNYKTRITSDGKFLVHNQFHFYPIFSSGTVIYKIQDVQMRHGEAQARCDQDSEDAGVPGFLHLPMPRNEAENQIYFDIISQDDIITSDKAWLDIVEVQPRTSPRSWVYKDGSPVTWFNWSSGEPNNANGHETEVDMADHDGKWIDHYGWDSHRRAVCTYFLPAGAENDCSWLHEFEN